MQLDARPQDAEPLRVGIDATVLWELVEGRFAGVPRFTFETLKRLLASSEGLALYVYFLNQPPDGLPLEGAGVFPRVVRPASRKLWQQTGLPLAAFRDRLDVMFFPGNSVSLYVPCATVAVVHDLQPYTVKDHFRQVHTTSLHGGRIPASANYLYWKWMLRLQARQDRIIAVSQSTKNDLLRIFGTPEHKIDVVYPGVDASEFVPQAHGESEYAGPTDRYILCVGTHANKNLEGSLRAFALLKEWEPSGLKLFVVGSEDGIPTGTAMLLSELQLEEDVVFTGFVSPRELRWLYASAEMLLFPSVYEGFGIPVLEAFASGTPVVTSDRASLPEVAGEAALLTDPQNPADIAGAMLKLLRDGDLREQRRRAGLERARLFSWERTGRGILEVVRDAGARARSKQVAARS